MDMGQSPAIKFHDVSFSYDGPPVLEGVNITIPQRDFVCVIGPNGGGKTTLVKLILGLIEPQAGSIEVLGRAPLQARGDVGYMPQHPNLDQLFPVSVMDVVLMGRLRSGWAIGPYRKSDKAIALRCLDEVGLAELKNRPLASLSGGQWRRVLIARALACEPKLLLLDEPTAHLDPAVQDDLHRLLQGLSESLTIMMVSHDVGFVSTLFKTAVCVNRDVHVHRTSELTSQTVADMYGRDVRLLHHSCSADAGGRE
ncbi:MAG: ABC transporter ATP-binding protein [Planctomycetes bacterium]|nr:ABC transporter ATP-binding protein [Planctomycetota bacterium]